MRTISNRLNDAFYRFCGGEFIGIVVAIERIPKETTPTPSYYKYPGLIRSTSSFWRRLLRPNQVRCTRSVWRLLRPNQEVSMDIDNTVYVIRSRSQGDNLARYGIGLAVG
jgi:hypothetical protein